MKPNTAVHFWEKVKKTKSCWLWTGQIISYGYGHFSYQGRPVRAHRFAYKTAIGPIPPGKLVCHTCDVRHCVNPKHLYLGTFTDNNRDTVRRCRNKPWNRNKTHCKNGHSLKGDNLYINPVSGSRVCRICDTKRKLAWQRKTRDSLTAGAQSKRTHCPQGHAYTKENVYRYTAKNGSKHRSCKACMKQANQRYRQARRQIGSPPPD
jgi:HNH endonuclease